MIYPAKVPAYAPTFITHSDIELTADNPMIGMPCPVCDVDYVVADIVALVLVGMDPTDKAEKAPLGDVGGLWVSGAVVPIHAACATLTSWTNSVTPDQSPGPRVNPPTAPIPDAVFDGTDDALAAMYCPACDAHLTDITPGITLYALLGASSDHMCQEAGRAQVTASPNDAASPAP